MRADQRRGGVLDRHDPDVATGELGQEVAIVFERQLDPAHLKDHGLGGEEIRRARQPAVERLEPFLERLRGLEHKGQKRAGPEVQGLSGGAHMRGHSVGSVGVSLTMVRPEWFTIG